MTCEVGVMKKEFSERFNDEVEGYRRALLYHARTAEWETFKMKAGSLFDYVEVVEVSEVERRFFKLFTSILVALVGVVIAVMNIDVAVHPDLQRVRYTIILLGMAASCFEVYFFLGFRRYRAAKAAHYHQRRDAFIRNIEQDFRLAAAERDAA